jgi:hypothetical protein
MQFKIIFLSKLTVVLTVYLYFALCETQSLVSSVENNIFLLLQIETFPQKSAGINETV